MSLDEDVRTTVIQLLEINEKPSKAQLDLQIRKAKEEDFHYFENSDRYSDRDIKTLKDADICVIVRKNGEVIHHTCIATKPFKHPRIPLPINIGEKKAYVYNIWTKKEHRGEGIFQKSNEWITEQLFNLGIDKLYIEIDSLNQASLKATAKLGFERSGKRYTIGVGKFEVHIITGENIYSETVELPSSDIHFAKTYDDRFTRITSELEPYVEKWKENDTDVVLFGAGNHAKKIISHMELSSIVSYAIDDAQSKIGSEIPDTSIPVYPVEKITEDPPDVVIVCSEAFQSDMVSRIKDYSNAGDIIVLYPHVRYLKEE